MVEWYFEKGPESDVVISSRVRLARNLSDMPFPARMSETQSGEVVSRIKTAVIGKGAFSDWDFSFIDVPELNQVDRQVLVEKRLVSPEFIQKKTQTGVLFSSDERVSIMVNEEDHVRIQCIYPGLQLNNAWHLCNRIDLALEQENDFAFNKDYGYLTCCPTNVGTGMRASAMLHLPALVMTGMIRNILDACGKLGLAVRGIYGENTEASGNMFQISNQVTLGHTEEEIVAGITNVISQIIERERALRSEVYKQTPHMFEDRIFRSYGLLANSRMMGAEESMRLLSDLRLGVEMGIVGNITEQKINELLLLVQPASLQRHEGKVLGPEERDVRRSALLRDKLDDRKAIGSGNE